MDGRRLPRVLATALDPMTTSRRSACSTSTATRTSAAEEADQGPGRRSPRTPRFETARRIFIGERTRVGERAYLWAGDIEGRITIGDDCRLGPEVFITASDYGLAPDAKITEQERNERDVEIGNDVWLGARVFVGAGVSIGDGSVVSAGSVVTKSLPPGSVAVGVPARIVRRREDYAAAGGDEQERAEPQVTTSA